LDIGLDITDGLNLHEKTIYVLRKTGHYDILYKDDAFDQVVEITKQSIRDLTLSDYCGSDIGFNSCINSIK
jgi:hypothetical protein